MNKEVGKPRGDVQFLDTYNLLKLNNEDIENLNKPIVSREIESVIKSINGNKSPGLNGFIDEFYKTFKEVVPILPKLSQRIERELFLLNSFYETSIAR
jgi:hypothetical protein